MIVGALRTLRRSVRLPPRAIAGPQSAFGDQPIERHQVFGNIVTTVYSAIAREITTKGTQSRFVKAGRGKFALRPLT